MTKKNILLTIGSVSAAAIPAVSVISCGVNEAVKEDVANKFRLESAASMSRVQEEFWWEIFKAEQTGLTGSITDNAYDVNIVKDMVDFVLKKHLSSNEQYLINMTGSHLQTKAMKTVATADGGKTTHQLATDWKLLEYRTNGDISTLDVEAKKFIIKNDKKFREEVLKNSVAYLFLNRKITRDQYKEIFMSENDKFTDIQKTIEAADFNLINEALKQHKFASWTVSLTKDKSMKYLNPVEPTFADVDAADNGIKDGGTLFADMKYSEKYTHSPQGMLPSTFTDYDKILGYKGFVTKTGTRGLLKQDLIGLKRATDIDAWNGYVEEDIVHSPIKYFKKDTSLVALERVYGLMPIYSGGALTLTGSHFEQVADRKIMAMELATSSSAYSEAEKYYYSRKDSGTGSNAEHPIQLEITSDDLRKIAIDHGFKFIKE